jgi:hypothetical protein
VNLPAAADSRWEAGRPREKGQGAPAVLPSPPYNPRWARQGLGRGLLEGCKAAMQPAAPTLAGRLWDRATRACKREVDALSPFSSLALFPS